MRRIVLVEQKRISPTTFHVVLGGLVALEVALLSIVRWIIG